MTSEMVESTWACIGFFLQHLDPDIRKITRRLVHLHLKILKKKQSVVFNRTCLDNDLLPKYTIYIYIYIYIYTHTKKKLNEPFKTIVRQEKCV